MSSRTDLLTGLAWALVLSVVLGALAVGMASAVEGAREAAFRYVLLALGVVAVTPTHALLPDAAVPWLVRLNRAPGALLKRAGWRWASVGVGVLVPLGVWASAPLAALEAGLLLLAAALYAFRDTMTLGPVSQAWQEGRRGARYRALVARDPRFSLGVPDGLVPGTLASARVYGVGLAFAAAAIAAGAVFGVVGGVLAAAALAGWQALRVARLAPTFDRAFYHSSALFQELLFRPNRALGERPPLGYDAVYWVPARWRPHVWAGLVQLDRRLPVGRLVVLSGLVFWSILALGVSEAVVTGFLVTMLALRNASIARHALPDVAPPILHVALLRPAEWIAVRTAMNLRWLLPTALILSIPALLTAALSWGDVLRWLALDAGLAFTTALLTTYAAEFRHRRRLA